MTSNLTINNGTAPLNPDGRLEVIVKYNGDLSELSQYFYSVEILNNSFAIITLEQDSLDILANFPQIEYTEFPKTLTYQLSSARYSACINKIQLPPLSLDGSGALISIIDSGIDVSHPDFRNDDGSSRILFLWDQSATDGSPPMGFRSGREFNNREINELLTASATLPSGLTDTIGHGTAVAGVAAGNGRSSGGREQGVAPKASLICIKLGSRMIDTFPRTTEIMRGVTYSIRKAIELNLPLSINISYGTNNGSHSGDSLFEQYMNDASDQWKTVICAATGNEGDTGHHFSAVLTSNESLDIPIFVSGARKRLYMTLWKNFSDETAFRLISPSGGVSRLISQGASVQASSVSDTEITTFFGQPTPLTQYQEVFFLLESKEDFITEGVWRLVADAGAITDGRLDIWLPTVDTATNDTAFATPDTSTTLTLPSTAERLIAVGGYNSNLNTIAPFSGRGYTRSNVFVKPDITAPAVNILTTRSGGGYMQLSGTSIACPFVTGASALMQEWGIVRKNDINLYGQRVKAFLQAGAKRVLPISYPNPIWGYGTLCLSDTFNLLLSNSR